MFKRKKEYKISLDSEDWVTPEEVLVDSSSQHSSVERPISDPVFRFFLTMFIALFALVIVSVFKISILDHEYFANLAFQNKSANFALPAPRGIIFDQSGKPLVKNVPNFDLLVVSRELRQSDNFEGDIASISSLLGINEDDFRENIESRAETTAIFFTARDIKKEEALAIQYLDPRGYYVVSNTKREYLDGRKFSQILGYTGQVNKEDLVDGDYFPTDRIGRLGIEAQYEDLIRGEHGNIFFTQESFGKINKEPVPGDNIVLSVDYDIQEQLYDSVWQVLIEANLPKAAALIQNPKNGAVLAMVSFPTFSNNIFNAEVSESDYERLFENSSKPLFNRSIGGLYNPGSTIKPFMGLAALQESIITENDTIQDCVSITIDNPFDPEVSYTFRNWRSEFGSFNLKKAIANSCNIYFYTIGGGFGNIDGLGIRKIDDYLKTSFADSILGIDIPGEYQGFVPTPEWKEERKNESWYLGDTYNMSIGQGDLLVTPLWLNTYVSAIANGGAIYKPMVAERVVDSNKDALEIFVPDKIGELPFSQDNIDIMRRAMRETVVTGTAKVLNYLPVQVAAKTGTAEVIKGRTANSLFTAFAPYDDPEISITILVEGADLNQSYALRIANSFLNWYFGEHQN